jgi:ribosomal protein S1
MSLMDPKNPLKGYAVGQRLRGRVAHCADFGVYVEVGQVDGFPIDAVVLFERGPDHGPAGLLKVGDVVDVIVTELVPRTRKLKAVLARDQPE